MASNTPLIPSTYVFDVEGIRSIDTNSVEFKEIFIRLYQNISDIINAVNAKDYGLYPRTETFCGQVYFPGTAQPKQLRNVYRTVVDFGALPNAALKSVAHGITIDPSYIFTRIYGTTTDPVAQLYCTIPYVSAGSTVELYVDATNVNIVTIIDLTAYTQTYVVLEYVKY